VANGATGVSCVDKQGMQVYHYTEVCSARQYSTDTVCQVNVLNLEVTSPFWEPSLFKLDGPSNTQ
jgi:hypothetical protein